jgi:NAD(P)H-nitrite reductase large subunit
MQIRGRNAADQVKVAGIDLLSAGDIEPRGQDGRVVRVDSGDGRQYQKLIVSKGRIRGAILIGHEQLADSVAAAAEAQLESR